MRGQISQASFIPGAAKDDQSKGDNGDKPAAQQVDQLARIPDTQEPVLPADCPGQGAPAERPSGRFQPATLAARALRLEPARNVEFVGRQDEQGEQADGERQIQGDAHQPRAIDPAGIERNETTPGQQGGKGDVVNSRGQGADRARVYRFIGLIPADDSRDLKQKADEDAQQGVGGREQLV